MRMADDERIWRVTRLIAEHVRSPSLPARSLTPEITLHCRFDCEDCQDNWRNMCSNHEPLNSVERHPRGLRSRKLFLVIRFEVSCQRCKAVKDLRRCSNSALGDLVEFGDAQQASPFLHEHSLAFCRRARPLRGHTNGPHRGE